MAGDRWIFTKTQLMNTPSRKNGIDGDKELDYRQQAANLIQDMGQRLQVNQLCINTAIVYMHRFYMFQSFTRFHRNVMAPASLFLAAKVEEQLRKLEHVLKVAHLCLHREGPPLDVKSEVYLEQAQELVINENILLQTLGFDMQVDHPHSTVVRTSQLVKAHKDLAQTSYFLATNSLHLTTMCLQYKPSVVACVCIYLASKWSEYEIQASHEGKDWFWYVDKSITLELLENLTQDFLDILERCPSRLKQKILKWKSGHRVEETFGPPPEKRHRGDAVSEPVAGTSRTAEKKTEQSLKHKKPENVASHNQPISKTKHSEALAGAGSHPDTPKVLPHSTNVSTPTSRSHENAIPVIKTQEVNSVAVPGVSETVAEAPSSAQMKKRDSSEKISIKDYKQYREYKEKKERESSGGIAVDRATENELRPSEQSSKQSESHRKEQYQHEKHSKSELTLKIQTPSPDVRKHDGSNLKKEKSESNLRYKAESGVNKVKKDLSVEHITMEASEVVNPLKLHIKREQGTHTVQSSGSPLKIKIKTHHSKEHKSERHSKSHDKSASDEHKPSLKLKLTEQMLKSHNQHLEKKSKHRHSDGSRESKQATASQPGSSSEKVNSNSKHSGKSRSSSKHTSEKTQAMFSPLAGGSHSFDVSGATNSVGLYGEGNGVHNPLGLSRSDSFSMSGESGVKSNGSGFHSPQIPLTPTKENLGQLNIQLQQLINQSKMQIAQQQQQQQYNHQPLLRPPPPPLPSNPIHGMFPTNYIPQVYHGGPPLPHAPPPPSPPKNPPPPPPPPHQSY